MSSIYYSAAWTECGCLISCRHEHKTVTEAASCIPCAGGYVVGVEGCAMRSLTVEEESEFQCAIPGRCTNHPALDTTPVASAIIGSGHAVMTRIRVGDHWTWTTWMLFATYAEAAVRAREGDKVVRFRSPEWAALRQHSEPASPVVRKAPPQRMPPQLEGETLVEFVLRFLDGHGVG